VTRAFDVALEKHAAVGEVFLGERARGGEALGDLARVPADLHTDAAASGGAFENDRVTDGVRRAIGFAGHRTFLYGALTAEENLRFYADLYGIPSAAVAPALERFGLAAARHRRVQELSRGLAQRLSLARALLHDPRVVLLDEPFTGLDAAVTDHLAGVLRGMRAGGCTVLIATHEWDTARALADDAVVFARGRVVLRTTAAALSPSELPALYATVVVP